MPGVVPALPEETKLKNHDKAAAPVTKRRALCSFLFAMGAGAAMPAKAQSPGFPAKYITAIIPFGPGSAADQHMRLLAEGMSQVLKVPIIIDPRPGGNGALAYNAFRNGPADGSCIMLTTSTTQVANPILLAQLPFDPIRDLKPVAGVSKLYQVMVVKPDFPAKSVSEFIALAKEKPGKLTFGSGTSVSRLGGELFGVLAGVKMLNVPYKSTPNAMTELVGGFVDVMFCDLPVATPMIRSGQVRALAVGSARRLSALPEVPTLQEAGVPDYEFSAWSALYVPPGTPDEAVARLHDAITQANRTKAADRFRDAASLDRFDVSPAELARFQKDDLARWKRIAAKLGITPA